MKIQKLVEIPDEVKFTIQDPNSSPHDNTLITKSPEMKKFARLISYPSLGDVNLLLLGDDGSGRTMIARALHYRSKRTGRFVASDCRGYQHDDVREKLEGQSRPEAYLDEPDTVEPGLFKKADGGTLVFRYIDHLTIPEQKYLKRPLEMGFIEPVGQNKTYDVDVSVVSTANSEFKSSLTWDETGVGFHFPIYLLLGTIVEVPSLAERAEDFPYLCSLFVDEMDLQGQGITSIEDGAVTYLKNSVETVEDLKQALLYSLLNQPEHQSHLSLAAVQQGVNESLEKKLYLPRSPN